MILKVDLGRRSYEITIARGLLGELGQRLRALPVGRQVMIVTDAQVASYYSEAVQWSLTEAGFAVETFVLPAGEASKSWDMAEQILSQLLAGQFHRDATILALGGGVVGDLAGFVASIYQRGIHFVQVPTSLLAQVDSSVGGKVAVNHALGKNMIGAFYQPLAVWIDLQCLATLEERHWRNGLAEVVKYGVIADEAFFAFLEQHAEAILRREDEAVASMIARCCQIKAEVVANDEQEKGERAKLNFGHTIGHGLESATHYQGYLHGEAVAIGMVIAVLYAVKEGYCQSVVKERLVRLLTAFGLPVQRQMDIAAEDILQGMALDKKIVDGQLVFILPTRIGEAQIVSGVSPSAIKALLEGQVMI